MVNLHDPEIDNYKEDFKPRRCFDCGEIIDPEFIKEYPDTEVCEDCSIAF